jgi:hypothetical protein
MAANLSKKAHGLIASEWGEIMCLSRTTVREEMSGCESVMSEPSHLEGVQYQRMVYYAPIGELVGLRKG